VRFRALLLFVILSMSGIANAAAKQVIILAVDSEPGQIRINYILWVTTSTPNPIPGATSAWRGASASENAALAAGTTVEIGRNLAVPSGTTKAAIQTTLQNIFTQAQAAVTSQPTGCFFDGTTWSC